MPSPSLLVLPIVIICLPAMFRNAYSFCGAWHTGSKLVLIAVMLRGRHRGLPVAIDKAVMLPDETLAWAEEEDAQMRKEAGQGISGGLRRRMSGLDAWEGNANGKAKGNASASASASARSLARPGQDEDAD
jgi:hypothetical protein